jgi:ribosomal protein S18 acetylase RimI-like enzyme
MRQASLSDKTLILDLLTRAFDDNKSVNYVVKQDSKRVRRISGLMEYSFNVCNAFGEVWISDDNRACALILFPDKKHTSLQTIIWDLQLAFLVIGIMRVPMVLKREARVKASHPKDEFAYLWFVGVDPEQQGSGIGSSFMKEVLHSCENKKRPVYLETSMERNLSFYKKLGFDVFGSVQLSYKLYQLKR